MKSLRLDCQVLTGVFTAILITSVLAVVSDLWLAWYLQRITDGGPAGAGTSAAINMTILALTIVYIVLFVVCAIVFLMWFYRAHKNLAMSGMVDVRYTSAWTVGGFFVPGINLAQPFQVMAEVWRGSLYVFEQVAAEPNYRSGSGWLVGGWWTSFLVASVLGGAARYSLLGADGAAQLRFSAWAMFSAHLMEIVAAALALLLVRRITAVQEHVRTCL